MVDYAFRVTKEARQLGICHAYAMLIEPVKVEPTHALDVEIDQLNRDLPQMQEKIIASKECQGFRQMFVDMNYPNKAPAGERLVRNFAKNGFKRINNIVDAYNLIVAREGSGIGMHDAHQCFARGHVLTIGRAKGNEWIIPSFQTKAYSVREGDFIYGNLDLPEAELFTWIGRKDVDSDAHKVGATTTSLLLVVTGNQLTSAEFNYRSCVAIFSMIQKCCPQATMSFIPEIS